MSNDAGSGRVGRTKSTHRVHQICPIRRPKGYETRLIAAVDADTGDVVQWMLESIDKPPAESDWLKLYKVVAMAVAADETYNGETRVLFWLMANIQFGNFVATSIKEIAEELHVSRRTVSRVVASLLDRGLLQRDVVRKVAGFRFNPNAVFMGRGYSQKLRRDEWNKRLADKRAAQYEAAREDAARYEESKA